MNRPRLTRTARENLRALISATPGYGRHLTANEARRVLKAREWLTRLLDHVDGKQAKSVPETQPSQELAP